MNLLLTSRAHSLLASPACWPGLAQDAWWRARPHPLASVAPTWPLDPETAASLKIYWPQDGTWEQTARWTRPLLLGFGSKVAVRTAPIPQPFERVLMIMAELSGKRHDIALDFGDYPEEIERAALQRSAVYFKMQHLREGYGETRIHPGGYTAGRQHIYRYLGRVRKRSGKQPFRYQVYGRFSLGYAGGARRAAVDALRGQDRFAFEGSLQVVTYTRSLREAADASVCVDLPGNGDMCHRLVDYLAVGACIVASRHRTRMHVPLGDGAQITYAEPDASNLVERCAALLEDPVRASAQRAAARDYFDRYLSFEQLSGYYLNRIMSAI